MAEAVALRVSETHFPRSTAGRPRVRLAYRRPATLTAEERDAIWSLLDRSVQRDRSAFEAKLAMVGEVFLGYLPTNEIVAFGAVDVIEVEHEGRTHALLYTHWAVYDPKVRGSNLTQRAGLREDPSAGFWRGPSLATLHGGGTRHATSRVRSGRGRELHRVRAAGRRGRERPMRPAIDAIVQELLQRHRASGRVHLNDLGEVIGVQAVTQAEIEAIVDRLEAEGLRVGEALDEEDMSMLRAVLDAVRRLRESLGRRPTVAEIARGAGCAEHEVRRALEHGAGASRSKPSG